MSTFVLFLSCCCVPAGRWCWPRRLHPAPCSQWGSDNGPGRPGLGSLSVGNAATPPHKWGPVLEPRPAKQLLHCQWRHLWGWFPAAAISPPWDKLHPWVMVCGCSKKNLLHQAGQQFYCTAQQQWQWQNLALNYLYWTRIHKGSSQGQAEIITA